MSDHITLNGTQVESINNISGAYGSMNSSGSGSSKRQVRRNLKINNNPPNPPPPPVSGTCMYISQIHYQIQIHCRIATLTLNHCDTFQYISLIFPPDSSYITDRIIISLHEKDNIYYIYIYIYRLILKVNLSLFKVFQELCIRPTRCSSTASMIISQNLIYIRTLQRVVVDPHV